MTKSILLAALAIVGLSISADSAFAGRRRCCQSQQSCCATQCCPTQGCATQGCGTQGTTPATPATNTDAPPPPQTTGTGAYQSYSYEPGSSAGPMMAAPVVQKRRSTSFYDQFRGDRKVRGIGM